MARIPKSLSLGREAGRAAASWFFDGNTKSETYERVLLGYEDGDPEVMDMAPASPLSGEWAGESMTQIFDRVPTDRECELYDQGYYEAFWDEVIRVARYHLAPDADPYLLPAE